MQLIYLQNMQRTLQHSCGSSIHPDSLLPLPPSALLLGIAASSSTVTACEHPVLKAQVTVAHTLEHATHLESPGNGLRAEKEKAHFHAITKDPRGKKRQTETLAGARAVVSEYLGEGESGLDGETNIAQEADVGLRVGYRGKMDHDQDGDKVGQE